MKALCRLVLAATAAAVLVAGDASAQTSSYRTVNVEGGKPARLATVTALKTDCSVGTLGGVRVVTPPKNGTLTLRQGKLKTPASFRCPNVETPVEGVFYLANPRFKGTDEAVYETKSPEGRVDRFTVRIEVGDKPDAKPKSDATDL